MKKIKEAIKSIIGFIKYQRDKNRIIKALKGTSQSKRQIKTILFLTDEKFLTSGRGQFHSWFLYKKEIEKEADVYFASKKYKTISEEPLSFSFPSLSINKTTSYDYIFLSPNWVDTDEKVTELAKLVKKESNAKVVIIDDGDTLNVTRPTALTSCGKDGAIAVIKNHGFQNRKEYTIDHLAGNHLITYVTSEAKKDPTLKTLTETLSKEQVIKGVKEEETKKLLHYGTFGSDAWAYRLNSKHNSDGIHLNWEKEWSNKKIDIMCKATIPKDWLGVLRLPLVKLSNRLEEKYKQLSIISPSSPAIPTDKYISCLKNTKIALCPFGYGELCKREYEAAILGCCIIHPNMGHLNINTVPNIFIKNKTYISVNWDWTLNKEDTKDLLSKYTKVDEKDNKLIVSSSTIETIEDLLFFLVTTDIGETITKSIAYEAKKVVMDTLTKETSIIRAKSLIEKLETLQ